MNVIKVDKSGVRQLHGKNSNPLDLADIYLPVLRCMGYFFQIKRDGIPPFV